MENRENFWEEAAETLKNNFSADDLLKSVDNEDVAIQVIKKVGKCAQKMASTEKKSSGIKRRLCNESLKSIEGLVSRTKLSDKALGVP